MTRPYHAVGSESDRVGPAQQPEWTARHAFAETDVYVIPPGEVEFNQYSLAFPKHGCFAGVFMGPILSASTY